MYGLYQDICPTTIFGGIKLENNDNDKLWKLFMKIIFIYCKDNL